MEQDTECKMRRGSFSYFVCLYKMIDFTFLGRGISNALLQISRKCIGKLH